MKTRAQATFQIEGWDEKPLHEFPTGDKVNLASIRKSYRGGLEAEGTLKYIMSYRPDGSAIFVGLEHVTGRLGERAGSFMLQHDGTFAAGAFASSCSVGPDSGTGELSGLRGEVEFNSEQQEKVYPLVLVYEMS